MKLKLTQKCIDGKSLKILPPKDVSPNKWPGPELLSLSKQQKAAGWQEMSLSKGNGAVWFREFRTFF